MIRTSAAALCAALLALPSMAQSQGEAPPRPNGPGGPGDDQGPLTQLFISPCGEPFRAVARAPYPVAAWFAKADKNGDGAIDRTEFRADADAFFDVLDVNHDGVISGFEVTRYEHLIVPEILRGREMGRLGARPRIILAQMGGMGGGMGGMGGGGMGGHSSRGPGADDDEPSSGGRDEPSGPSMEGAAPFNLLAEPEPVSGADIDFDSRITRAEFQSKADRRFRQLDAEGHGKLTLATLPMTQQQKFLGRGRPGPPRPS